ncbi:unnamed protein product [Fraxinus pennsylvanica]|uniref:Uncharacterized protein n=1 Tax=Fraxinus pennsylvanica TaxID=56036 RepID=A0AAD1ZHE7_9LAMI|nr:unnamed protein product [Fraxinus pennsylvanica]
MQYAASAAFLMAVYSDHHAKAKGVIKCPEAQVLGYLSSRIAKILPQTTTRLVTHYSTIFRSHRVSQNKPQSETPVEFLHSITNTWTVGKETYYRHQVISRTSPKIQSQI